MENRRDQGRESLNTLRLSIKKNNFLYGFISMAVLSSVFLILSFSLPILSSSHYQQKRLDHLRGQAEAIKNEFANLIGEINRKQKLLLSIPFPDNNNEIFDLFKKIILNKEKEGAAYLNSEGDLILWLGNAVDLKALLSREEKDTLFHQKSSFLILHKASIYLVSALSVKNGDYIILYRLLAFTPEFKTPYLQGYQFLKAKLLSNCDIRYWEFREDVSGFEKLFLKHKDEYSGEPRYQAEAETIIFPLRNEENKIVATVTLSSPPLSAKLSAQKENLLLFFYLLLGVSLVFLLIHLIKSTSFSKEQKLLSVLLIILTLIGLRLIFFPLGNLAKIQSLPIFSPSQASFFSVWNLTKSPADIFLTSFFLFLISGCLFIYFRHFFESRKKASSFLVALPVTSLFVLVSLFFISAFQEILFRLVYNSNINLLHFSFNLSFLLLHLSLLLFFLVSLLAISIGLKFISNKTSGLFLPLLIFSVEFGCYLLIFKNRNFPLVFLLQALVVISILFIVFFPGLIKRKEILFSVLLLFTLFISVSLHYSSSSRKRSLIQNSLQNIIRSQENWGIFILQHSLPEIDKKKEAVISFLKSSKPFDLAHSLWEGTLIAKFNWYSNLEILNPKGEILSRFSLNVPRMYQLDFNLPSSRDWSISRLSIPFMGEEREFLLGYKDWFERESHLGRTILYLSVDYDMLPFLYSANPYFELLRVTSIPSLNQLDFGFAIFNLDGKPLFKTTEISSGIPPNLLGKINSSQEAFWSSFTDKRKIFQSLYFKKENRIYSLFIPKKNFFNYTSEFLGLLFFYLLIIISSLLLISTFSRRKFKNPLWSFSNRVYIALTSITLISLLLFTLLTRSFFGQIFARHFTEKAEAQATLAQRVMKDFILFQQEEMVSPVISPEDVVPWISSTISNDVNLYQDGKLISSSRREFFDYGLFPDLIDGEIYYKIQYENNPFYTQTQKIGDYSFHTLTAPFFLSGSLLLISLPFPLEQQEISKATEELIEFLFFISVFLIAFVLIFARGIGTTIVTPIKKLLLGTKEVSSGNLEISIMHKHQDEMKTLIDGFNTMVKNLKKQQQELTEMGKKAAWAEIAQKVAHEIKNPLTPIQLSAEHLLKVHQDKDKDFDKTLKESVSYIIREVENLRKISLEFLEISKEKILQKELFNLKELLQETVAPYKNMLSERITFKEKYEGQNFDFLGDRDKMKTALRNILTNAIEAIQTKGEIKIKASKGKDKITLEIKDTGIGIKKEMLEKIFEPYFSTKEVGTGLGLPIAKKIIEDHGGSIKASSKKNEGTRILVTLPTSHELITP